jgi:hypothetical protein
MKNTNTAKKQSSSHSNESIPRTQLATQKTNSHIKLVKPRPSTVATAAAVRGCIPLG